MRGIEPPVSSSTFLILRPIYLYPLPSQRGEGRVRGGRAGVRRFFPSIPPRAGAPARGGGRGVRRGEARERVRGLVIVCVDRGGPGSLPRLMAVFGPDPAFLRTSMQPAGACQDGA